MEDVLEDRAQPELLTDLDVALLKSLDDRIRITVMEAQLQMYKVRERYQMGPNDTWDLESKQLRRG